MKIVQRFLIIFSVILTCFLGMGKSILADSGGVQTSLTPYTLDSPLTEKTGRGIFFGCIPEPRLQSDIPKNPYSPLGLPECKFANFAWATFVALNWPTDLDGEASENKTIGQEPQSPRVWEFYPTPTGTELLGEDEDHSPIQSLILLSGQKKQAPSPTMKLRLNEAAGVFTRMMSNIRDRKPFPPELEKLEKPLIDRSGNYILNEIRINPVEAEQIKDERLDSPENIKDKYSNNGKEKPFFLLYCSNKSHIQDYPQPGELNGPGVPCQDNKDVGAIEIKAAWMVLPNPVPDNKKSRYYTTTRDFWIESEDKVVEDLPVALVGFHIMRKTSRMGWVWATFEHVCNVPPDENADESIKDLCRKPQHSGQEGSVNADDFEYNLYDPNCDDELPFCQENTPFAVEPYLWRDEFPHAVTTNNKEQIPSQIIREVSISSDVQALNREWQQVLAGSVWENYQLIGVQWLRRPSTAYQGRIEPVPGSSLVNVTLEPYVQQTDVGSSCIACHHQYATLPNGAYSDFSFLFTKEHSPF